MTLEELNKRLKKLGSGCGWTEYDEVGEDLILDGRYSVQILKNIIWTAERYERKKEEIDE
jgi:hypothetical protein